MAINSKQKGKRGELELVHYLKSHGIEARRGQQFHGGGDSPDVIAGPPFDIIHIEVKRREAGNPYVWVAQAIDDAKGAAAYPVVFHKRNDKPWLAILTLDDFTKIMRAVERGRLP